MKPFSFSRRQAFDLNAIVAWEEFCSARGQRQIRRTILAQLPLRRRLMFHLSASAALRELKRRLTGQISGFAHERLTRLPDDLRDIDFQRDVLVPLGEWEGEPGAD